MVDAVRVDDLRVVVERPGREGLRHARTRRSRRRPPRERSATGAEEPAVREEERQEDDGDDDERDPCPVGEPRPCLRQGARSVSARAVPLEVSLRCGDEPAEDRQRKQDPPRSGCAALETRRARPRRPSSRGLRSTAGRTAGRGRGSRSPPAREIRRPADREAECEATSDQAARAAAGEVTAGPPPVDDLASPPPTTSLGFCAGSIRFPRRRRLPVRADRYLDVDRDSEEDDRRPDARRRRPRAARDCRVARSVRVRCPRRRPGTATPARSWGRAGRKGGSGRSPRVAAVVGSARARGTTIPNTTSASASVSPELMTKVGTSSSPGSSPMRWSTAIAATAIAETTMPIIVRCWSASPITTSHEVLRCRRRSSTRSRRRLRGRRQRLPGA